jgi:O-antigen/teichoic acid export membrane protein
MNVQILFFGFVSGIVPSLLLLFSGEKIFLFIFGNEWQTAGKMASYIVLWYFIGAIVSPINLLLDIYKKLNIELYWNIALFVLRMVCLLAGYYYGSIWLAIASVSFVSIIMNLLLLFYAFKLLR